MENIIINHPERNMPLSFYQEAVDYYRSINETKAQFGCDSIQALIDKIKEQQAIIEQQKDVLKKIVEEFNDDSVQLHTPIAYFKSFAKAEKLIK